MGTGLPSTYSDEAKEIGKKIESIKSLVTNANDESDGSTGFLKLSKALNTKYHLFLKAEIDALKEFKKKILDFKSIFKEYIGEKGDFFDFLNCKFLGTNLKVILKSLKYSVGENIYTIGICLTVLGCSIAIAICTTLLLIIILDENKKKK